MSTAYSIEITLDDTTLTALQDQNMFLVGYKGVKANGGGGKSTVWLKTQNFSDQTTVQWSEQYGAYIDSQQTLKAGLIVDAHNSKAMNLGQTLNVKSSGVATVSGTGAAGKIAVNNEDAKPWVSGMTEVVNGSSNPLCAFPLNGNFEMLMEPIETVLLMVQAGPVNTGTVVESTISKSLQVTLSGDDPTATVSFDINKSWDTNGNPNAIVLPKNTNLADQLITPLS